LDYVKLTQSVEILKLWEKLTGPNGLQMTIMMNPFKDLEKYLDFYVSKLFKDSVTHFELSEKSNSFSFGISRNGSYISMDTLSSGERCMFILALMIVILQNSNSKLKLILVDDLFDHLDNKNMEILMNLIDEVDDIQFILAGVYFEALSFNINTIHVC